MMKIHFKGMMKIRLKGTSRAQYLETQSKRCSIIIRRKKPGSDESVWDYIRIGSCFHRTRQDRAEEVANITGVSTDSFGIPHIRYDMRSRNPFSASSQYNGSKMLSLPAFISMFNKRQSPPLR